MIYQIYILIVAIMILLIHYSFVKTDRTYYTDIITAAVSIIFAFTLAQNSIIGVEFNHALESAVQYDTYISIPLTFIFGIVGLIMLIFTIVKILDITHSEVT